VLHATQLIGHAVLIIIVVVIMTL